MAQAIIDSRYKGQPPANYSTMADAVAKYAEAGATIAGPPKPTAPFDLQGVEKRAADKLQAQQNQGPMPPMIVNGAPRFQAPAVSAQDLAGYGQQPAAAAAPAASATPAATAAPRITGAELTSYGAPNNPLGGMNPALLSGRGGPMSYSQKGVGTTSSEAYAVGRNSRRPTRDLERFARRDPRAAAALAEIGTRTSEGAANRDAATRASDVGFARELQLYGMKQGDAAAADQRDFQQSQTLFDKETARRAGESETDWNRRKAEKQAERDANKGFTVQPVNPADPSQGNAVLRGDGSLFNLLPGQKPEPPALTAKDLEGYAKNFPDAEIEGKLPNGMTIRRRPAAPEKPNRLTPIPGAPSQIQGGAPTPDRVFDPYAGEFYEAGKVPGRGSAAAPAAPTPPAAPTAPPAGAQTPAGAAPAKKSRFMDLINKR